MPGLKSASRRGLDLRRRTIDLSEKVCVVTGASSGIGRRAALDLAAAGARVCAVARREERLSSLVEDLGGEAAGHRYVVADVSQRKDVSALAEAVRGAYGRCDVLINNAGISNERRVYEPGYLADLEVVMETNFLGAMACTAELMPLLLDSAPANVVNVASVAGRLAAGSPAYCASKFALVGWSEAARAQLESKRVFVSLIEPGLIPTEGFPHTGARRDRLMRYALGTEEQVSRAILEAIRSRPMTLTVPRWYYLLQIPRVITPPLYRAVQKKMGPRRKN
jgi:NAD(P)-dependent dehydrogenase (short-subunit alcohol dehydrogenase family)